ncbi:MAG: Uma2 family endonuclease [Myxococcota bacterium]
MQARAGVSIRYAVPTKPEAWIIPEGTVPESPAHDAAAQRLSLLLSAWASKRERTRVARNLAVRWLEAYPRTGIDPDVCVLSPAPEDFDELGSLRLWEPGRTPPIFCVEVVSPSHPHKDYSEIHERYAALGAFELLVFDPLLVGPRRLGGPVALQLWRRDPLGSLERVHFGDEPVFSEAIRAWFSVDGHRIVISHDREGTRRFLTAEEQALADRERALADKERAVAEAERAVAERERERAEKERERAEKEREQRAREALERRVEELERARLR